MPAPASSGAKALIPTTLSFVSDAAYLDILPGLVIADEIVETLSVRHSCVARVLCIICILKFRCLKTRYFVFLLVGDTYLLKLLFAVNVFLFISNFVGIKLLQYVVSLSFLALFLR